MRIVRRAVRWLLRLPGYALLLLVMLFGLQYSTQPAGSQWYAVSFLALDYQFDYLGWEVGALVAKIDQTLFGLHPFMSEAERAQTVRDYLAQLQAARGLEAQINALYADPSVADPAAASAALRAQRDALRADLSRRQSLVEAILEGQVAAVLVEQGFGALGQLLPPIAMRFSPQPDLLVVSPRDRIQADTTLMLDAVPVEDETALEGRIDQAQNVSSLVVPIGGLALFPAMVVETTSLPFIVETFAHEWLHNYLLFFPLGVAYFERGESVIINETTANLFGQEIGRLTLERYYPDLVPPPSAPPDPNPPPRPAFDFGLEMRETRVRVDELLAEGKVEEAEAYMEARRRLFVANGYPIRKLNQAYFAFYGNYQTGEPGAGGEDPIGPAVQAIRERSASIFEWIAIMRDITTRDQLLKAADSAPGN